MLKGNFFRGLGYLGEGFGLIRQPGLRLFVVIPLIINILLFGLLFYFLAELFTAMIAASIKGRTDVMEKLVQASADVNVSAADGRVAAETAAARAAEKAAAMEPLAMPVSRRRSRTTACARCLAPRKRTIQPP